MSARIRRIIYYTLLLAASAFPVSCSDSGESVSMLPITQKAIWDSTSVYYMNFSEYPQELSGLPIGVFDSSTDGFTVIEKLLTADNFDNITGHPVPDGIADFGGEYFQVLYDKSNAPFGGFLEAGNIDFLKEQLIRDVLFLMGDKYYNLSVDEYQSGYKEPVKMIVVSSPVADYYGMSDINALLAGSGTGVKAVDLVGSAVKEAVSAADEEGNLCIGVLYSPDGVTSRDYETIIRKMAADSGLAGRVQVFNQEGYGIAAAMSGDRRYVDTSARISRKDYAGPVTGISYNNIDVALIDRYGFDSRGNALLYPAGGRNLSGLQLNSVENYVRYHLVSLVERHRRSGSRIPISSIILADCSFCHVRHIMDKVMSELYNYKRGGIYLYRSSISPDFRFIDPAECAAKDAYRMLREEGMLALRGSKSTLFPFVSLPSSTIPSDSLDSQGMMKESLRFGRISGAETITTKVVPFSPRYVTSREMKEIELYSETFSLIRNSLY